MFLDALLRPSLSADIIAQSDSTARAAILDDYDVGAIVNQHWAENYDTLQRDFLIEEFGIPAAASNLDSLFLLPQNHVALPRLTFALHPTDWGAPELWDRWHTRYFADQARLYMYSAYAQKGAVQFTAIPGMQLHRIHIGLNGLPITTIIVGDSATYTTPVITLPAGLSVLTFTDLDGSETIWGDLRCVGATPLAGKLPGQLQCDPHRKGTRQLSIALQNVVWLAPEQILPPLAHFGKRIALMAEQLPKIASGTDIVLPLTFRSLGPVGADLTLFVHVFGPYDTDSNLSTLLSQWDDWPLRGNFATSGWKVGEQLGFRVSVPLPSGSSPGEYRVELGWYESATGTRLPVSSNIRETHDNVLVLGNFALREK